MIYLKINNKTYLNRTGYKSPYKIIVRFYPGSNKPIGHAHKILQNLDKPKPPIDIMPPITNTSTPSVPQDKVLNNNQVNLKEKTLVESKRDEISKNSKSSIQDQAKNLLPHTEQSKVQSEDSKHIPSPNIIPSKNHPSINAMIYKPTYKNLQNQQSSQSSTFSLPNTVPSPPPPPPMGLKKSDKSEESVSFTEQIKDLGSTIDTNSNIKPSAILKSKSGKEYITVITKNTTINDISDKKLIIEMKKRELITDDLESNTVTVKDNNNNDVILGQSKNGIKITSLGQAYSSIIKKSYTPDVPKEILNSVDTENIDFMIIIPPRSTEKLFLEVGNQKHLLVVYNKAVDEYYSIGYFTSKKAGEFINNTQYKDFQDNYNKEIKQDENKKTQYFKKFNTAERISAEDIIEVKYSKEYLDFVGRTKFIKIIEKQKIMSSSTFNKDGLTKEDCLNMCIAYDNIIINKKPHPLTKEQIEQQQFAKIKQQEEQQKKKLIKYKKIEENKDDN